MELVDRKESDVSIGTQPEEERMQRHQMIEASNNSMIEFKGIMISIMKDRKQTLCSKYE